LAEIIEMIRGKGEVTGPVIAHAIIIVGVFGLDRATENGYQFLKQLQRLVVVFLFIIFDGGFVLGLHVLTLLNFGKLTT
jgi:hypothetical protein